MKDLMFLFSKFVVNEEVVDFMMHYMPCLGDLITISLLEPRENPKLATSALEIIGGLMQGDEN